LTALALALAALPLAAQEDGGDESDVFTLGTVYRVSVDGKSLDAAERLETLVTKTDIELFEKKDIGTALGRTPGVRYGRPSGGRYESGVFVRGFQAYGNGTPSVPVFIDGIPAYVPYDYVMDMGRFTTSGVSTISVSKGYSSVLYGPNALGGAINIVSQRPNKPLYGNITVGMGLGDTIEANGVVGTLQNKWYAQAAFSLLNRDYIRMAENYKGTDALGVSQDTDRKNYGTSDKKMEFKFGYLPNATDEYVVSYLKQTGRKGPRHNPDGATGCTDGYGGTNAECWAPGYMDTWWEWPYWDRETVSFVSTTNFKNFYIKPRVYYDKYDNGLYGWGQSYARRDQETGIYDDYAWGGSLEIGTEAIENNVLKAKFDYKFDQHKEYSVAGRANDGAHIAGKDQKEDEQVFFVAIEDTYKINDHWMVQGGLLYSRRHTTLAGDKVADLIAANPSAGFEAEPSIDALDPEAVVFYNLNKKHALHYSIAKKTRFPSIRQQYSNMGSGQIDSGSGLPLLAIPNPDLKPEKALHHEVGWDGEFLNRLSIDVDWFYSKHADMIGRTDVDTASYPGFAVRQVVNIAGDVRRQGLDLGVNFTMTDKLLVGTSFSYIHSVNRDDEAYRFTNPAYNGSLYASVRLNSWAELVPALDYYAKSRYGTSGANRWNYSPGTALVDLKLTISPPENRNLSFNIGAENLFDTDYRGWGTYNGTNREQYPTPGRYIYANVRYKL
jgi:iron complex outermembrane receptor protein